MEFLLKLGISLWQRVSLQGAFNVLSVMLRRVIKQWIMLFVN